ncbi:fibronectin type III domain-containing protein [Vallicoccus soli]|uniref:Fibronectin type-III domain-containing protein n=1 Tax=Vallicoccus soli TaxID=2339232 RepID=A0A3A3Z4P9_9ACTN|nr:fibronectin type III domain-containing protein [Vallicoccus soli]RJK97918.1 hypothetical protein D5H78_02825 [Vallicoccus soli]
MSASSVVPRLLRVVLALAVAALALVLPAAPAGALPAESPRAAWTPTGGRVYAVARVGDVVLLGGSFTALRSPDDRTTVARARLAALDAGSGALLPWDPGASGGDVRALEVSGDGSTVYVGGYFTGLAGQARRGLGAVGLADGRPVAAFGAEVNIGVHALERIGSTLFLGGTFTYVRTVPRARLAAVDAATGALLTGWSTGAGDAVNALAATPDGTGLLVGGHFRTLAGQPRDYVGRLVAASGALHAWRPPAPCLDSTNPCIVYDLAADTGSVYAAVGGPGGRVSAWDGATGNRRWASTTDGDVQAVALEGTTLYAGGHFDTAFAGQPRAGLVALSAFTGGVLPGFAPRLTGGAGVWDVLPGPDHLRVGGGFTLLQGTGEQRYAEFPQGASSADTTPPTTPQGLTATAVGDTQVTTAWSASTDDRGVVGYRLLRDGALLTELGGRSWTDTGLVPGTRYAYRVEAVDAAGNRSAPSAPLEVTTRAPSTSLVRQGSTWRYLSNGSDQGTAWRGRAFDDRGWAVGDAQLGYGDGDEVTVVSPLGLTHYFRQSFQVADPAAVPGLRLRLLRDDGAVVHLNGTEVWRTNMPAGPVTAATPASTALGGAAETTFVEQLLPSSLLLPGTNVVAVEVHNAGTSSSDVSFDLELSPTG